MKTAIITGASGGVGSATAKRFMEDGWYVIGIDREKPDYEASDFIVADITNGIFDVRLPTGTLDCLINNAAVQVCKPLKEITAKEWAVVIDTNLIAPAMLIKLFSANLFGGAIVNVASVHAIATSSNISAYAASKGGLVALTRQLAIELAPSIRVNAVLPGAVDTQMLREGLDRTEQALSLIEAKIPMGRVGHPGDIAEAILFLGDNNRSSYITGQILVIDGGVTARLSSE